jgi:hypothetical protein
VEEPTLHKSLPANNRQYQGRGHILLGVGNNL